MESEVAKTRNRSTDRGEHHDEASSIGTLLSTHGQLAPLIFSFLGIRELYNMVFCSKTLIRQLRYEHVIRSVMMVHLQEEEKHIRNDLSRMPDNQRRRQMRGLIQQIEDGSIWVPSVLRMLRLFNGKRCEVCNESDVYGLPFGLKVCCCGTCVPSSYAPPRSSYAAYAPPREGQYYPYRNWSDARIARQSWGYMPALVWSTPFFRDTTGELCGPILTFDDVIRNRGLIDEIYQERVVMDSHRAEHVEMILGVFRECDEALKRRKKQKAELKKPAGKANGQEHCAQVYGDTQN